MPLYADRGHHSIFHFTSDSERTASLKRFPGVRGIVIPNGVQVPEKFEHAQESDTLYLLYLGRLDPDQRN